MKVLAILNPENGTCGKVLSFLQKLSEEGKEIKEILLPLENTYKAQKWVISLSMPISKEEIEKIKENYLRKITNVWNSLGKDENLPPLKVEVYDVSEALKGLNLEDVDLIVVGCLENHSLCKLIETLDKPVLVVKN